FSTEPKPKARLISMRVTNGTSTNFDWQGRMQNWGTEPQVSFQFQHNTNFEMGVGFGYERLFEQDLGPTRTPTQYGAFFRPPERSTYQRSMFANVSSSPSKKYSGYIFLGIGHNSSNFDFGAGSKFPRVSPAARAEPNAALDPGPGTSLDIN